MRTTSSLDYQPHTALLAHPAQSGTTWYTLSTWLEWMTIRLGARRVSSWPMMIWIFLPLWTMSFTIWSLVPAPLVKPRLTHVLSSPVPPTNTIATCSWSHTKHLYRDAVTPQCKYITNSNCITAWTTFLPTNRDSTNGALITTGNNRGSMLSYSPLLYPDESQAYDFSLRSECCEAGLCDVYFARRPSDDCSQYQPLSFGER